MGKGFKAIGGAMKALGIGLIIALFAKLGEILSRNQKVVDAFSTVMTTLELGFNAIIDAVTDAFDKVNEASGAFDALGKVMGGIITVVLAPFKLQFFGIKLALLAAQLAWEQSFFGNGDPTKIMELQKALIDTKDTIVQIGKDAIIAGGDIVKNFGEAVDETVNFGKAIIEETSKISVKALQDQAEGITKLKNAAQIAAAEQDKIIAQAVLDADVQRGIRDDETKSIEERQAASKKLKDILDEQSAAATKQAEIQVAAAQSAVNLNSTTETRVALLDAEKNAIEVVGQVAGLYNEQLLAENGLTRTSNDLKSERVQKLADESQAEADLATNQALFEADRITNDLERLNEYKRINEEKTASDLKRQEDIIADDEASAEQKEAAEAEITRINHEAGQQRITDGKAITNAQIKLAEKEKDAKLATVQAVGDSLALASDIVGKETAAGKAFAVASALISTYQGIAAGVALGYPAAIPAVIAAAAAGFAAVKNILAVKVPG